MIWIALLWFVVGATGFVFWWTRDYDLTEVEMFMALLAGFMGPFAWLVGWLIHGKRKPRERTVLMRKRR